MEQGNIRVIMGVAAHHPMLREDIIKKVGRGIADTFTVSNHNVFENNEYLGKTSAGSPVYINRDFLRADVKICVGSILPHGGPGFGGGAKLVLPGVAGIETIYQNHRSDNGYARGVNRLEGNLMRSDMEEAAAMAGLNFIVNTVVNPKREIVGLFCGHFVAAHRQGCELARLVYGTPLRNGTESVPYDVAILSAYPKDSECYQHGNAMNVMNSAQSPVVHEKGSIVTASAGSQGMGEHFLAGPGFRLGAQRMAARRAAKEERHRVRSLLFCENVSSRDMERWGGDGDSLCRTWREVVNRLRDLHGAHARVAVFPCAAMQLGCQ
jgi:nickel-dependent lactate racemase